MMDHRYHLNSSKVCFIPQRYVIALMTMCALTTLYNLRIFVPKAYQHMVVKPKGAKRNISKCPEPPRVNKSMQQFHDPVFPWSPLEQKITARCFFAGYLIGHFPGGIMSDLYGGKDVMTTAIVLSSFTTLLTPIIYQKTNGHVILVSFMRVLMGVSIGLIFPSAHSIISQWCPARDRGKLTGIIFAATQWSITINNLATNNLIIALESWASSYYFYGSTGMVLLLFWVLFASSCPQNCRYLDHKEFRYLSRELAGHVQFGPKPIPWARLLRSLPLWSLVLAQIGHTWIWHGMAQDLPKYLKDVLKINILKSDLMASLPYAFMSLTTIFMGCVSDCLINRNIIEATTLRKAFTTFGAMGPGIFIVAAGYDGYLSCNKNTAIMIFTVALCTMSCYYAGTRVNCFDLAPNYSGLIMGLANGLGALPGIVAPLIADTFTKKQSVYGWMYVFWTHLFVLALTNILFVFFGSAEEQPWNWGVENNNNNNEDNYSIYSEESVQR